MGCQSAGSDSASVEATMNRRGRLCGTNRRASTTNRSQMYPSRFNSAIAARKSAPPCDVANDGTFSRRQTDGRRALISSSTRANSQNMLDSLPASPARFPASERSVHGKDAVARDTSGMSLPRTLRTSARTNSSSPKFAAYMSCFASAMSFAQTTANPARSKANRTRPIPAKNSAARGPLCEVGNVFSSALRRCGAGLRRWYGGLRTDPRAGAEVVTRVWCWGPVLYLRRTRASGSPSRGASRRRLEPRRPVDQRVPPREAVEQRRQGVDVDADRPARPRERARRREHETEVVSPAAASCRASGAKSATFSVTSARRSADIAASNSASERLTSSGRSATATTS